MVWPILFQNHLMLPLNHHCEYHFETFCELAGKAGVPVWMSDLVSK